MSPDKKTGALPLTEEIPIVPTDLDVLLTPEEIYRPEVERGAIAKISGRILLKKVGVIINNVRASIAEANSAANEKDAIVLGDVGRAAIKHLDEPEGKHIDRPETTPESPSHKLAHNGLKKHAKKVHEHKWNKDRHEVNFGSHFRRYEGTSPGIVFRRSDRKLAKAREVYLREQNDLLRDKRISKEEHTRRIRFGILDLQGVDPGQELYRKLHAREITPEYFEEKKAEVKSTPNHEHVDGVVKTEAAIPVKKHTKRLKKSEKRMRKSAIRTLNSARRKGKKADKLAKKSSRRRNAANNHRTDLHRLQAERERLRAEAAEEPATTDDPVDTLV